MRKNFDQSLKLVLKSEGGYVNHPKDPGGPTNMGVTLATYRRYVNRHGTIADLKRLTWKEVSDVYRQQYWDKVRGDDLPSGVDYAVFDFAVNSGPNRATKFLQRLVGSRVDGWVGPNTLDATAKKLPALLVQQYLDNRLAWLKRLKKWPVFGRGWTNRIKAVRMAALKMAAASI